MAYHPTPKAKTIFFSLFLFLFYFMVNKRIACVFGWRSWAGAKKLELTFWTGTLPAASLLPAYPSLAAT